ncbi:hypothetical protein Pla175_46390 [Pirellulimonas nuda]|uniref:Uncharacterized protein n=1 Tax=Pirellulimonas nuda TaxID=2528009 RepID=A0A518DIB9_9BACT|nr:hypothetical protein [Pirellulimonas nuda]QDU91219.1 hypothetical protein Pla175_46390 [Pirellulimonas nuda]
MFTFNRAGRPGVSSLQFVGCIAAATAGIVIGSQYVGMDLQDAAYTALDEGRLLEHIPEDWRPATPQHVLDAQAPLEEKQASLRDEIDQLREEADSLAKAVRGGAAETMDIAAEPMFEVRRQRTAEYWARVHEVIQEVSAVHNGVEPAIGGQYAARMLELRRRACHYGRRSIEALDSEEVDPQAVETARRVAVWFHHGVALYERAVTLVSGITPEDPALYRREDWSRAEEHHRKEAEYVRLKNDAAAASLGSKYGLELSPWGL